ncbi:MAG TPA: alpha/beta hydrolase-fold protein [Terracidiphilus sp.]|nr:alpha/beta hydrolase-fold protein [Terracidiphilus sp.]
MRRLFLAALLAASVALAAAQNDYTLGPDSQPQPGVPQGTVTHYTLPPGKFYPGTPHHYAIYVPVQYNPARPTPFMIFLDGSQALGKSVRASTVFDNLIAQRQIPVMIGIFVDPGVLPAFSDQDQNRYERIFEYDSLSPRFSSFLLGELIPAVAAKYNLSTNPDDRALSGVSTGAVGAFMAAWNRPDQFHRVLSFIGTYVDMKGADHLPALIRKTQPKPIRIFMQDGTNDHIVPAEPYGIAFAGSWPINNQVMYQALQYSGYDVKLVMGHGTHSMNQGGAIMPDALRWLWRDYPAPIVVHENPAMHEPGWDPRGKVWDTLYIDKPWQEIEGAYSASATLASDKNGNAYFADPVAKQIDKIAPDGSMTIFRKEAAPIVSLRAGAAGRLYAAEPSLRRIVAFSANGEKIIARNVDPTALAVTLKGAVYFTDQARKTIHLIEPSGHVRTVYAGEAMALPAGVTLSPDQAFLIVSDAQSRYSWSFQIAPDGSFVNGEPFYRLEMPEEGPENWLSRADDLREDSTGQVYFATPLGIQVSMPNGRVEEILNSPHPGPIAALTFAAGNPSFLYVVEDGKIYRRPVKVTPAEIWAPNKPSKPTL